MESEEIYRVILDPKFWENDDDVEIFYPIGCSKTFTGFFTRSLKDALNILEFLHESYSLETNFRFEKYPSVIIKTELSNVITNENFKHLKTDNNSLFDKKELFVEKIKDESKLVFLNSK